MSRYERIEPPEPEPIPDSTVAGICPICEKPIYYDDENVYVIDGFETMIHEDCMIFKKEGLSDFLERLGIDYYKVTAEEIYEEGY